MWKADRWEPRVRRMLDPIYFYLMANNQTILYKKLPDAPGVYLMRGAKKKLLYVGKAINLRRRVSSYFLRPHDSRIEKLVSEIKRIDHEKTESALEALLLEAKLIKELQPPYNILQKDDKSFLCIEITKEKFPRVILVRAKNVDLKKKNIYGPFLSGRAVKEALKIIRRIFPFSIHPPEEVGKLTRPCFDYQLGLCPGTCVGAISEAEYKKNIDNIKLIFNGKKRRIISNLKKEMKQASNALNFEKADRIKRQIFGLEHIRDISLISSDFINESLAEPSQTSKIHRIEGYDISNISGTSAVGGMVVFTDGEPNKKEYRRFKIKTIIGANDVGMLEEVLRRRFARHGLNIPPEERWPDPDLILIDGGLAQVNVAEAVLHELGIHIPVIGIAKGPERKRNDIIGHIPEGVEIKTLVRVRDEAHRYSIGYHKKVREGQFFN